MKQLLSIILTLLTFPVFAQFTADRPGVSTGVGVVEKGVIQWEQGVAYEESNGDNTFTYSNTLLRYGLFNNMEIRLGGDGFVSGGRDYFSGLSLGTKIGLYEGRGAIPAISVLAQFTIPHTASEEVDVEHLAPSFYLLFENPITDWFNIGYNVGAEWDGSRSKPATFVALCLGFSLCDKLGCFVESYNYFDVNNKYGLDFGFNYQVAERLQLDIAANLDLKQPSSDWGMSLGVAWQINRP